MASIGSAASAQYWYFYDPRELGEVARGTRKPGSGDALPRWRRMTPRWEGPPPAPALTRRAAGSMFCGWAVTPWAARSARCACLQSQVGWQLVRARLHPRALIPTAMVLLLSLRLDRAANGPSEFPGPLRGDAREREAVGTVGASAHTARAPTTWSRFQPWRPASRFRYSMFLLRAAHQPSCESRAARRRRFARCRRSSPR